MAEVTFDVSGVFPIGWEMSKTLGFAAAKPVYYQRFLNEFNADSEPRNANALSTFFRKL